ncbi:MAG TPA: GtrA family protein [Intrasporangium sp.]|uniref:GtrA family protein n=1 Tax=Intrasporangium sp. TaxID=1925024 RepID=UPI002D792B5E|nr:GtrA family protein [Intrasporangium sp.]HET7399699.1 GtrA family protein [Intrasporangium sp.]
MPPTTFVDRLRAVVSVFWREVAKFGVIGAISFVIDLGGMNLLTHTVLSHKPTTAKILSGVVATIFAWVGNRSWTFRHRRSRPAAHEVTLFFLVNGVALAIAAAVLAFSHYVLGFQTRLADNVASVIGIGLGTLFRFWSYRRFVFAGEHPGDPEDDQSSAASERNNANLAG